MTGVVRDFFIIEAFPFTCDETQEKLAFASNKVVNFKSPDSLDV